jgi:1,4-dihydroxy-2-naphthoate polyprenyltransferase
MTTLIALYRMARPLIIISVVLVYLLGFIMPQTHGDPGAFVWGLLALLLVTLSIHYVNEYADVDTDAITRRTPFSGGSGVLPSGVVPRQTALTAAWIMLALGVVVNGLAIAGGVLAPITLLILVIGAWGGWMYSMPPLKLAWCCMGEATNAILGGLILPLYGYAAAAGGITGFDLGVALPFTLFVFLNLLATTWADRHADAQVGKYTLATRLPAPMLRGIYAAVAISAFMLLFAHTAWHGAVILPLAALGWLTYTHAPLFSVGTMIVLLLVQISTHL